jgi:hypothetical protein
MYVQLFTFLASVSSLVVHLSDLFRITLKEHIQEFTNLLLVRMFINIKIKLFVGKRFIDFDNLLAITIDISHGIFDQSIDLTERFDFSFKIEFILIGLFG